MAGRPLIAVAALVLAACGDDGPSASDPLPENPFQRQLEHIAWLDDVDAPKVSTADEVSELWQSKKRCCVSDRKLRANNREFFKACYVAIGEHFDDDELVTKCLWLMDAGAEGDQVRQIKQYLIDHYFDHDTRTDNCANCAPADVIARVSRELAQLRSRAGKHDDAARFIERALDERLGEISPWVQVEMVESLGRIYLKAGVTEARKERIRAAYQRLSALAAAGDETVARRIDGLATVYGQVEEG